MKYDTDQDEGTRLALRLFLSVIGAVVVIAIIAYLKQQ